MMVGEKNARLSYSAVTLVALMLFSLMLREPKFHPFFCGIGGRKPRTEHHSRQVRVDLSGIKMGHASLDGTRNEFGHTFF